MLQAENTSEKMELEVGVSNVERPNYSNHEFSAVLFPENPYPATINVDITEKQYPLSPNRNVTSFSIAVADAKNETNVEYITGHVRDGKLEYTSMQPVTLGQAVDISGHGITPVFQAGLVRFVVPTDHHFTKEGLDDAIFKMVSLKAFISNSRLREFVSSPSEIDADITSMVKNYLYQCSKDGTDPYEHGPKGPEVEGYEKWRDKELGITGHTSEGGWEVDVCIRGESFPYAVECYEQAKSDLSNLCIAVDTKIEKAIDDISARLPKNPNLRIHLLGEHGFEDLAQSMSNNEDVIRSVKTEGSNLLVEVLAAYQAIDGDKPLEVFESPDGPLDYGFELFGQKFYYDNEASAMHESEIATKFFVETVRSMVLEKDKQ